MVLNNDPNGQSVYDDESMDVESDQTKVQEKAFFKPENTKEGLELEFNLQKQI